MPESRFAGRRYFLDGPDGREELGASYDDDADVLYLWRGERPAAAVSLHTDDGPIVRLDLETGELVGITLLDWSELWADKQRIDVLVPAVGPSESAATAVPPKHRELVLA